MSGHTGLSEIVEVTEVYTEEEANKRLQQGWVLLDAKILELRTAPHFTEYSSTYMLGRRKTTPATGNE